MTRTILLYGVFLALGTLGLKWLEFHYLMRTHPAEAYLTLISLGFLGLGIWIGARHFRMPTRPLDANSLEINTRATATLGISERELEVLQLLAAGQSNKEIAGRLSVSPNTVKTHVANLFAKLEARRRTEAIMRARELRIIV